MRTALLLAAAVAAAAPAAAEPRTLRVCADPNNAPFTDDAGSGFENHIARIVADELGARLVYTWWPQHRGFFRNTLKAERCDLVLAVPVGLEMARPTRPYYRSVYTIVTRADRRLDLRTLDDPRLRRLRIAVQLIGDDGANAPPAHALARRGIVDNVVGYSVFGDYGVRQPGGAIIAAVARGDVDVALVWGPLAGPLARASAVPLVVTPLPDADDAGIPMAFAMAMGVRRGDGALAAAVDRALVRRRRDIEAVLDRAGVPRLPLARSR